MLSNYPDCILCVCVCVCVWGCIFICVCVCERESVAIGKEIKGKEKNMEVLVQEKNR